jgi:hypothetical protein
MMKKLVKASVVFQIECGRGCSEMRVLEISSSVASTEIVSMVCTRGKCESFESGRCEYIRWKVLSC